MKWLARQLTNRDSGLWDFYETTSQWFATILIAVLYGELTELAIQVYQRWFPENQVIMLIESVIAAIKPYGIGILILILCVDAVKPRLTRCPQDHFLRRFKYRTAVDRFHANDVVISPGGQALRLNSQMKSLIETMLVTKCPKCNVTHVFSRQEATARKCVFYACGEKVPHPGE